MRSTHAECGTHCIVMLPWLPHYNIMNFFFMQHVDKIGKLLLLKTGENATKFLISDAEEALVRMVDNVSAPRAVVALSNGVG